MQVGDHHVDQLNAEEGGNNAPYPIDQEILTKQSRGADWAVANPAQGKRNERNDNNGVKSIG